MYRVRLQCGHETESDIGPAFISCSHCRCNVAPAAFELREWVVYCQEKFCRFREVVESKDDGFERRSTHRSAKHGSRGSCPVDFLAPESLKKLLASTYGRKVKFFINEDTFGINRNIQIRSIDPVDPDLNREVPPF